MVIPSIAEIFKGSVNAWKINFMKKEHVFRIVYVKIAVVLKHGENISQIACVSIIHIPPIPFNPVNGK